VSEDFFIQSLRKLLHQRLYAVINIAGLATGIACFTVLLLLILHETGYDDFHPAPDRLYRITETIEHNGVGENSASVPFPVAANLQRDYPQLVEKTVRLFNYQLPSITLSVGKKKYNEKRFFLADSTFFEVFGFKLAQGDARTALAQAGGVVLTAAVARKYFGGQPALGQTIKLFGRIPLRVTGVLADLPGPSHLSLDLVASLATLRAYDRTNYNDWVWNPCWTYLRLRQPGAEQLQAQLPAFAQRYFPAEMAPDIVLGLQLVRDIHLHSALDYEIDTNGDIKYIYVFGAMALFIAIIAAINYMNLTTAQASVRVREVVVKKAIGADRQQLFYQFLFESLLIGAISVLLALMLVEVISPYLTDLSGAPLGGRVLSQRTLFVCVTLAGLFTGIVAGIYPAVYLSSFEIGNVFHGRLLKMRSGQLFRSILVVTQFVISILLLTSSYVSKRQLDYMRNMRLGFDKDHLVLLPITTGRLIFSYDEVRQFLLQSPAVRSVTAMEEILGKNAQTHEFNTERNALGEYSFYPSIEVTYDFLRTFDMELVAGRDFVDRRHQPADSSRADHDWLDDPQDDGNHAIIVNEAMVRHLGYASPAEALGKPFSRRGSSERIVGVVKNFHFASLHSEVTPFAIDLVAFNVRPSLIKYLAIKIDKDLPQAGLQHLAKMWEKFAPGLPYEYLYLRDDLDRLYMKEQRLGEIATWFSVVAILIACMGLFGLSSFVASRQRKEIGIRKAIGADALALSLQIGRRFILLVLIGVAVAVPAGYWMTHAWLASFPYRIPLRADLFIWPSAIMFGVTALTVSYHAIRASLHTPVESIQMRW
jgi:putative ABC transport system permease protein